MVNKQFLALGLLVLFFGSIATMLPLVRAAPTVNYVDVWSYPDNNWVPQGGTVNRGRTARIYAGISDPVEPVSITYTPQGGSPTTVTATHETTWDYYYIDWTIPSGATLGLYDVKVDTGVVSTPSVGMFQVGNLAFVSYVDVWSYPDNNWTPKGGIVNRGYTARIYAGVSNPGASVDISYGPTGGELTTVTASLDPTWGYWYIDWAISDSATLGLYDVKVATGGVETTSVGRFQVGDVLPLVRYIDAWSYTYLGVPHPGDNWITKGGTATIGHVVRLYAGVSNPGASVEISYMPQGGSWTTVTASYESTWDYYYIDWTILDSATLGLYDVKVETNGVSVRSTGRLTIEADLLVDSRFDVSADDAALRSATPQPKWYESRGGFSNGDATRLTLETADIGYNVGKKAGLKTYGYTAANNAYLTQQLFSDQTGTFSVSFDIYVDRIENIPGGSYPNINRGPHIYVGNDASTANAPCGTSNERFVYLTWYDPTPDDKNDGNLQIRARTLSTQGYGATSAWIQVCTGLNYNTWYTVKVVVNVLAGTYDVYLNGAPAMTSIPRYSGYTPTTSVRYVVFAADGDGRGDYYIDNVFASTS